MYNMILLKKIREAWGKYIPEKHHNKFKFGKVVSFRAEDWTVYGEVESIALTDDWRYLYKIKWRTNFHEEPALSDLDDNDCELF